MAQHDYNIANQTGANFRADLNNALSAISSNNSGSSEPSTMYAYEWWIDTTNDVLKLRNSANNAWITMPFSITADNTVDINAGTVNGITSFSFSSGATVTSILDEDNLASDSATALATQQSIKAYVDSQVTAQDLDITDGSSTIAIDLDSETLSLLGGTGVTATASGNGVTFAIGQSVGTSDNVVFNQVTGALVGNASTATALATARTISGVSFDGTANITLDTDDIGEGSNKYFTAERVDDQVNTLLTAGANISLTYDDTAGTLTIANTNSADITSVVAGNGLTGGGTAGDVTLAIDSTVATLTGTQTLTNKTLTSPILNGTLSGTGFKDEDNMSSNSATAVASQQSIKAYVDSQVGTVDTLSEILANGNTTGGTNINFGDNDKAIFGTGNDLQIYHDSTAGHSIITDVGTGNLLIRGTNLNLQDASGFNYLVCEDNGNGGVVRLRHNDVNNLATTSTGIDVTGTVTSDGLTLDGANGKIYLPQTPNTFNWIGDSIEQTGIVIIPTNDNATEEIRLAVNNKKRLSINYLGDISFYEDTGTSQALFWDASAESLGLGTTSPSSPLSIGTTGSLGAISNNNIISVSIDGGFSTTNATQHKVIGFVGTTAGVANIYDSSYASGETSKNFYTGIVSDVGYFNSSSYRIVQGGKSRLTIKQDGEFVINDGGQDRDFRVESDNNTHMLFVDGGNDRVGIGTDSPSSQINTKGNTGLLVESNGSANYGVYIESNFSETMGTIGALSQADAGRDGASISFNDFGRGIVFKTNEGASNSEAARFDSSGRLGLGTTSPSKKLHVSTGDTNVAALFENTSSNGTVAEFLTSGDGRKLTVQPDHIFSNGTLHFGSGSYTNVYRGAAHIFQEDASNTEIMRITGTNIGIGTTSPTTPLHVFHSTTDTVANFQSGDASVAVNFTASDNSMQIATSNTDGIIKNNGAGNFRFFNNGSERARIDSSGNLLVGRTSTTISNVGITLGSSGSIQATNNFNPLGLNRLSGDGDIAVFQKSGTTVGSIGTEGGRLIVGSDDTYLFFDSGSSPSIRPHSGSAATHNIIDIGESGTRFKDLYLEGTARIETSVGIGTDSPDSNVKLDLNSGTNNVALGVESTDSNVFIAFKDNNTTGTYGAAAVAVGANSDNLLFRAGSAEVGRFNSSGQLLIGKSATDNTTVGTRIDGSGFISSVINGGAAILLNRLTSDGDIALFRKDGTTVGAISSRSGATLGLILNPTSGTGSGLSGATNAIFPIDETTTPVNGEISLGTTSNKFKDLLLSGNIQMGGNLDVVGQVSSFDNVNSAYTTMNFRAIDYIFKNGGGSEKMRLDSSGNLLVGGSATGQDNSFAVGSSGNITISRASGSVRTMASFTNGGPTVGTITTSTTATAYNTSSDARLKDVTGKARGLEVINELNPVAYNWKADGKADEGLIAQEVLDIVPNAVSGSEDDMYQMDYSKLVVHLVAGMKEQQKLITTLQAEVALLKEK